MCALIPRLDVTTRIVLVMHRREILTTTASGPLALAALANSELLLHGVKDAPVDLNFLHDGSRRVLLLYPSEDARPLSSELLAEDPRPITLIVPDGSWRQASRAARRIPGVEFAERVTLPPDRPTEWGLRRETKAFGLATFEAIARSLGILEGPEVRETLEGVFRESVRRQKALRPFPPDHQSPEEDDEAAIEPADDADEERLHIDAGIDVTPLPVLYQDDWLVCVNKPSGQLVHRGWGDDGPVTLQTLREQLGRPVYPVHRLDRQTSGALLLAFYPEVARDLQRAFEGGLVTKRYLALCRGNDPELKHIDHPLTREPGHGERKDARTDFRWLGSHGRYGLYEVFPRTGSAHQIRRHLKHASHPIIGDVRYGKGEHNRLFRQEYDFHRLALHCACLGLPHPRTGATLQFEAPLPADFERVLTQLGLWPAPVDG
jgi:tRNA pseudouridine65 synthase